MDEMEMYDKIEDLVHLDTDAAEAYREAIERVGDAATREQLASFKEDHERHIAELTAMLLSMGRQAPERKPDLKGRLLESMTALRSALGDQQALKAMRQNETITNRAYEKAMGWDVPEAITESLARNHAEEQRHLVWIEERLSVMAGAGRT